jgi:tetratricopeptide (TPR) repeat protein
MTPLKTQAIHTALTGDWTNAIECNRKLLEEDPDDIDTLNRLAYAFASMGDSKEAKNIYQKVLTLDNQNPIAVRNLKRLSGGGSQKIAGTQFKVNNIFIEEPGKTKVIDLINVAEQKIISRLHSGEYLELAVKRSKIFALDGEKQFVGMLPDDLGKRLIKFIEGGNGYEAYVKTVDDHRVTVFVKETRRSPRFKYQSSFSASEKPKFLLGANGKKMQKKGVPQIADDDESPDADSS